MNKPINVQTIHDADGKPLFVVMSYQDYLHWYERTENLIPHEVVDLMIQKQFSPIKAWREYLKLTPNEVAKRMGIAQAAFVQMEAGEVNLPKTMLSKIASALNINIQQLNV